VVDLQLAVAAAAEAALRARSETIPSPVAVSAMIDTGATGTVLQAGLPQRLGLNPVGSVLINTPGSTNLACYKYLVRMIFPKNVTVEATVIEAPLQGQHIQCLIGRDVLSLGVLIYIGYTNTFTLSF